MDVKVPFIEFSCCIEANSPRSEVTLFDGLIFSKDEKNYEGHFTTKNLKFTLFGVP